MKYVGAILIIICSAAVGLELRSKASARVELLGYLCAVCLRVSDLIRYERLPPGDIIRRLGGGECDWMDDCAQLIKNGTSFAGAWNRTMDESRQLSVLHPKELEQLRSLGAQLGGRDMDSELELIKGYHDSFCRMYSAAFEDFESKSRLYTSCSVLAGMFIAILVL